jgi:microcystin-dependent protein
VQGNFNAGDVFTPGPTVALTNSAPGNAYVAGAQPPTLMSPSTISVMGSSLPHNNLMPYLVVTFIIALQGIFPPRN